MNYVQRQLVWSGAAIAGLLALAGAKELSKPSGANCKDEIQEFADRRDRWVIVKSRVCE